MTVFVQKPAPAFKKTAVIDGAFEEITLDQFKGKWFILAFIPMAFTFVCPTEIIAYSEAAGKFKERGAELAFASVDSEYSLLAWTNVARKDGGLGPIDIPLISDKNHTLSKDYGVLLEEEGVALRGIFIIDPAGNVRQVTINDLPVGRNVEETLRLLDAFQFTDKYGEVCPANWHAGDDTMKPDPTGSKEYFSKQT
ncbi:thioredoxin-like protein [Lipomyces oligophaga]|uniref:thioredoxin-like protein n=1 Tax=Lipomyces oligophaga TaxID=45792 RepID=UPI0034CF87E6